MIDFIFSDFMQGFMTAVGCISLINFGFIIYEWTKL